MERYRDVDGDAGVAAYELGPDYVRVEFTSGAVYLYTEASAGAPNIAQMKRLAARGDGLTAFITRQVRRRYARRER